MEKRIFELLRKNKIGHVKAWYLTHELLRLYNVVGRSEQLICPNCIPDNYLDEHKDGSHSCPDCGHKEAD